MDVRLMFPVLRTPVSPVERLGAEVRVDVRLHRRANRDVPVEEVVDPGCEGARDRRAVARELDRVFRDVVQRVQRPADATERPRDEAAVADRMAVAERAEDGDVAVLGELPRLSETMSGSVPKPCSSTPECFEML
jgi:hypothetical protein